MLYPGLQSDLFNLQILQFSFVLFAAQFGLRLGVRLTTREIGAGFLLFLGLRRNLWVNIRRSDEFVERFF